KHVEEADDANKGRILKGADDVVHQRGNDDAQCLRQHDATRGLPVAQADGIGRLVLAARDCLQAATHDLRGVGGAEHDHADLRTKDLVDGKLLRHEEREHYRGYEQHCHERDTADDLDHSYG